MSRWLPVLLAQVPARAPAIAVEALREEVHELLAEFPATRLIVYPEYHTCDVTGGPEARRQRYEEIAEPIDGPRVNALRGIAREAGVWLVPGTVIERGSAGEIYNTAPAISPAGELVGAYRKIFPWRPFEPFTPGDGFSVFDIPGVGRVGLCICYDLWFPEVSRQLAWMGAEVIVCPTFTSTCDRAQELVLSRATAIQNQVYFVAVNTATPQGTGQSIVVDPEGLVRVQAPDQSPALLTDVLDLDAVTRVREHGTCGLNRMWSQFKASDAALELPVYAGSMTPERWQFRESLAREKKKNG